MAKVEVALDDKGSLWVSYDPKLVRAAIEALEAHDAAWDHLQESLDEDEDDVERARARLAQALRTLSADPDRLKWQVDAYTLSHTRPTGPRLVLLADDDVWSLVAADETEEAADRDSQVELLTDANFGNGAAMLRDFLEKAEADS